MFLATYYIYLPCRTSVPGLSHHLCPFSPYFLRFPFFGILSFSVFHHLFPVWLIFALPLKTVTIFFILNSKTATGLHSRLLKVIFFQKMFWCVRSPILKLCFLRRQLKLTKSSPSIWHYVVNVKSTVKILSFFVAFLHEL